jgi:uncharacterized membrane protein
MYATELCTTSFWWIMIIPLVLMMILCISILRGRRGASMCCSGPWDREYGKPKDRESISDVLDRRYASGEIDGEEYKEMKRTLSQKTDATGQ